jgi:hypothetical protein
MAGMPFSNECGDVNGLRLKTVVLVLIQIQGIHPNSHTVEAASKMLMIVCPLRSFFRGVTQTERQTQIAQKVTMPGSAGCHLSFS